MLPGDGFNLVQIDKYTWVFEGPNVNFKGSFKEVVIFAMYRFNIKLKEIDSGISAMVDNHHKNHNAMNFGILGNFIISYNSLGDYNG